VGGEYYFGDGAWKIIQDKTQVNLKSILEKIANHKTKNLLPKL
jgi:hypothetical protein